jgi:hypothetical protein
MKIFMSSPNFYILLITAILFSMSYFLGIAVIIINTLKEFGNLSRKEFALKFKDSDIFGNLMRLYGKEVNEEIVSTLSKELITKKTNSLGEAKKWLELINE